MSDISIPGVNSKYGTDKMIKGLMDAERIPLKRLEDQKQTYDDQKTVWQSLNTTLKSFRDSSKLLYGFENPFKEHIADSSDESILSATADRDSTNEIIKVKVNQLAGNDRLLSKSLPSDFRVPKGIYSFKVGDSEISFKFNENRIQTFVEAVNKRSKGLMKAKLLNDTADTVVLLLEATKTGSSNKLLLQSDSIELGLKTGIIKTVDDTNNTADLNSVSTQTLQNNGEKEIFSINQDKVKLAAESKIKIPFTPPVDMKSNLLLQYKIQIINLPKEEYKPETKPKGPQIESPGSISFEGITIDNSPSRVKLPEWTPPPKPKFINSLDIMSINGNKPLPTLKDLDTVQQFSIPYSTIGNSLKSIDIDNINTNRQIIISDIKVINQDSRNGYEALNPVSSALDAKLTIDGIPVTRESNSIDDLIQGVTLNLNSTSDKEVKIDIKPDRESIKNKIIEFVGNYNQILQNIHILTSRDPAVISELDYLSDDEKKAAKKNLGLFQGDMTFSQLKNRLQQLAMKSYTTPSGNNLNLLSQIGISTNSSGFGGGINKAKLRGYLEINEGILDEALKQDVSKIRELFGADTDGDLIVDSGAAYEMDKYISSYTQVGGLVATRIAGLSSQISSTETDITNMDRQLDDKETQLRIKFGRMESALKTMEQNTKTIDNFSNSNN